MRRILLTATLLITLLILNSDDLAGKPASVCMLDPAEMPMSWRPPPELQKSFDLAPWSEAEARDAEYAKEKGVEEMIALFREKPSAVEKLLDDSVAALLQVTYASANRPEFDAKVRKAARKNLTALITPYLGDNPESAECGDFQYLLPLAIYAHRLYPANDTRTKAITEHTNAAYRDCGSLDTATENILRKVRFDNQEPLAYIDHLEDLFDLYYWTLLFIEAELYPDIKLPSQARTFPQAAWKYFETFPLPGVSEFKNGIKDEGFITLADLATHIAHIPSGLHRFPIYVEDKPDLYRFLRENFYPVLASGDRDLFAMFVDTLRQYGCTPENDIQVRDGTRHLLEDFHKHDDKWMNYSTPRKTFTDPIEYVHIHHAWTAVLGIRDRKPEPPEPGTYGGVVRRWLPHPR